MSFYDTIYKTLILLPNEGLLEIAKSVSADAQKRAALVFHEFVPDEEKRHKLHTQIIQERLSNTLENIKPNKKLEDKTINSWDQYLKTLISTIENNLTKFQTLFSSYLKTITNHYLLNKEDKQSFIDNFINFLEEQIVSNGLGTAFTFIVGMLRVIPKLWKEKYHNDISKETLIELFTKSQERLEKWASQSIKNTHDIAGAMPVDPEILNESNDDTFESTINFKNYDSIEDLIMFHPRHFSLNDKNILEPSQASKKVLGRIARINLEKYGPNTKTPRCPALDVEISNPETSEKQMAIAAVCEVVTNIIRAIPDDRFNRLIAA